MHTPLKNIFLALILCFAGLIPALSAAAAAGSAPVLIGNFTGWKAYHFADKGATVCYMSRQPDKQEPAGKKRGQIFFFITRWSGDKDKNVVSVANGYSFKEGSAVTVTIGGKKFALFTQGGMAWTKDQATDNALVKEIKAGATMTVKGTSSRGTETTDTYSLKGSGDAFAAITEHCNSKGK